MTKTYTEELNSLVFSEEEKTDILERLTLSASSPAFIEKASSAEEMPTDDTSTEKKTQHSRLAVPLILMLLLSLVGGTAYAVSEGVTSPSDIAETIFGADPSDTKIVEKIGHPVSASASDEGITITADSIIGDKNHIAIVYSLQKDDGTPFPSVVTDNLDGMQWDLSARGDTDVERYWSKFFSGPSMFGGAEYFYDQDPSDPAIQFVQLRSSEGIDTIIGRTVKADFRKLTYMPINGDETVLADGRWKLSFVINYEDTTVTIPINQRANPHTDELFTQITISPISFTLSGSMKDGPGDENPASLQVKIALKNGEMIKLGDNDALWFSYKNGKTFYRHSMFLPKLTDTNDVKSIYINDIEIPLN